MTYLDNEICLLSSQLDRAAKKNHLMLQIIDKTSLKAQPNPKKILTLDFGEKGVNGRGDFNAYRSEDFSKVLAYYIAPTKKGVPQKVGFTVLGENQSPIWSKKITLPHLSKLMAIQDFQIDNQGNVNLLAKVYDKVAKERRNGKPNFHYELYHYKRGDKGSETHVIKEEDVFLQQLRLSTDKQGDITCAGFYSTKNPIRVDGLFSMKIDRETQKTFSRNLHAFKAEVLKAGLTKRGQNRIDKGKDFQLSYYKMRSLRTAKDGGTYLIAEQVYVDVQERRNGRPTFKYHYLEILTAKLQPNGEVDWVTQIPKYQYSVNDRANYSSFMCQEIGNKLYFVYNDHVDNITRSDDRRPLTWRPLLGQTVTMILEIDEKGKQKKWPLLVGRETKTLAIPKASARTDDNELLIFAKRGKQNRFHRLTF